MKDPFESVQRGSSRCPLTTLQLLLSVTAGGGRRSSVRARVRASREVLPGALQRTGQGRGGEGNIEDDKRGRHSAGVREKDAPGPVRHVALTGW